MCAVPFQEARLRLVREPGDVAAIERPARRAITYIEPGVAQIAKQRPLAESVTAATPDLLS
jgi:hypothetical protein